MQKENKKKGVRKTWLLEEELLEAEGLEEEKLGKGKKIELSIEAKDFGPISGGRIMHLQLFLN